MGQGDSERMPLRLLRLVLLLWRSVSEAMMNDVCWAWSSSLLP